MFFHSFIRESARVVGQAWTIGMAVAVIIICGFVLMPSFDRGTILTHHGDLGRLYMLALLALPGYALVRWGSAPFGRK
jgi:hypothetical protein